MDKTHLFLSPEQQATDLAHMAWCALVSLRMAQQDGKATSPLLEHAFLSRWLANAHKQRRFPRSVSADIEGLLRLSRHKGYAARLQERLDYMWRSCNNVVKQRSDLLCLSAGIDLLKPREWVNAVVEEDEWNPAGLRAEYAGSEALLVRKSRLASAFTKEGDLHEPLDFLVLGNINDAMDAFITSGLRCELKSWSTEWGILTLLPSG